MCGICGVVLSSAARRTLDQCDVLRMRDALRHRGPDDAGMYFTPRAALGHRRLSIIDVAGGHQPMANGDGSLQIVYNGEVFNHAQIRSALESRGYRYATRCDTESVLLAFQEYGPSSPTHLRGMFAYAVWNERAGELFLARDRLGIKPLYYALLDDGSLVFASEIKAILASGALRAKLNGGALPDYLANHAPSGDETLFDGIRRLPAGHTLTWRDGTIRLARYWDVDFTPESPERSEADYIAEYAERFRDAVSTRLMSDVPLGVFLSGGIDSASIAAMMSQLVTDPIKTFSVAFEEREANELEYARLVADRFRTDHHEVVVTPRQFFDALPKLVWHEDEPIAHPSSVALNFVSRLAAEHVKVVLTGEGSDETLAGYNRYRATIYNMRLGAAYERLVPSPVRAGVRRATRRLAPHSAMMGRLERTFLGRPASLEALYFDSFSVFGRTRQAAILSPALRERLAGVDPYAAIREAFQRATAPTLLGRLLYADIKTYLHELLMKQDQMSMAASIESRVPFLDHPLVEYTARMPDALKLRGLTTKYVLRRAMANVLPPAILSRKKMGFPVPIGPWFRGAYRPVVDEYVLGARAMDRGLFDPGALRALVDAHQRGTEKHGQRLWALVNLELWHRVFIDGEDAAGIRV